MSFSTVFQSYQDHESLIIIYIINERLCAIEPHFATEKIPAYTGSRTHIHKLSRQALNYQGFSNDYQQYD